MRSGRTRAGNAIETRTENAIELENEFLDAMGERTGETAHKAEKMIVKRGDLLGGPSDKKP